MKDESLVEALDRIVPDSITDNCDYEDPKKVIYYNRIRAALMEHEKGKCSLCGRTQDDHTDSYCAMKYAIGDKPSPSGLDKLDEHTSDRLFYLYPGENCDLVRDRAAVYRRWQREHDRLLLEEVDRKDDQLSKELDGNFAERWAEQNAEIGVMMGGLESRIIARVADEMLHALNNGRYTEDAKGTMWNFATNLKIENKS